MQVEGLQQLLAEEQRKSRAARADVLESKMLLKQREDQVRGWCKLRWGPVWAWVRDCVLPAGQKAAAPPRLSSDELQQPRVLQHPTHLRHPTPPPPTHARSWARR